MRFLFSMLLRYIFSQACQRVDSFFVLFFFVFLFFENKTENKKKYQTARKKKSDHLRGANQKGQAYHPSDL